MPGNNCGFPNLHPFFTAYAGRDNVGKNLAFIQFIECSQPKKQIYQTLSCDYLRWSTEDGMEHGMEPNTFNKKGNNNVIGEWFSVELLTSIHGAAHVMSAKFSLHPSPQDFIGLSIGLH